MLTAAAKPAAPARCARRCCRFFAISPRLRCRGSILRRANAMRTVALTKILAVSHTSSKTDI
jgi:hypothetical protein